MELSSVAFVKKPVLSAFALGRSTAVVLDSGHSFTSCSIVEDGYCAFSKTLNFGGSIIHNLVRSQI
jgi:actin-related protein